MCGNRAGSTIWKGDQMAVPSVDTLEATARWTAAVRALETARK